METGLVAEVVGLLDGIDSLDARQLAELLQEAERIVRAATAVKAAVAAVVDRTDAFREDGHTSVVGWVGATVTGPRRSARETGRLAEVCTAHPVVFEHLASGSLSVAAANELARVHGNLRVRDELVSVIEAFVTVAERATWDQFVAELRTWEQLTDADGAHHDHSLAHQRRHANVATLGESTFLDVRVGAVDGTTITEVLERFTRAEFDAEWDDLVATHGDDACPGLLSRSDAQRRADAVVAIFRRAAATAPDARDPEPLVSIVVSQAVFEEQLGAMLGERPADFSSLDPATRWCATTTGAVVDPADAVVAALAGHVRRVVIDGTGRVIDLGRRRRLFTGAAREAVVLQAVLDRTCGRCCWPGCGRLRTQLDHAVEWRHLGPTDVRNAALPCGHHNRVKSRGYRVWRDAHGVWHTARPDGTEIRAA